MISERQNDGIERDRTQWFRRANSAHPERGGAPKSRSFHGREWMEQARERWASLTNEMLKTRGRPERVDHRSYERQGIDREPGHHYGPGAAQMVARGLDHDRFEEAVARADRQTRSAPSIATSISWRPAAEAAERGAMGHDDEPERRRDQNRSEPGRDEDLYPGR